MQFIPGEIWDIPINNVKYKARRYYKRIDKNDFGHYNFFDWIKAFFKTQSRSHFPEHYELMDESAKDDRRRFKAGP